MKLQINKRVSGPKSAVFAVIDSINYYVQPESLRTLNVPKLADKIVTDARREYGEGFTKANLETTLNKIIKGMTTETKSTNKPAKPQPTAKKEVVPTEDDLKIIKDGSESFNKRIAKLPHLWGHQAVLAKEFGKSRQRVINAIKLAKAKQK